MNCVIPAGSLKVFGRAIQFLAKVPGEELYFDATEDGSGLMMFKQLSNLEKSIDFCKLLIDLEKCRLIFQLCCKYGITRTNNFILYPCESMETFHNRAKCKIKIIAPSAVLVDGVMTNFKNGQEDVTLSVNRTELTLKNCVDDEPEPEKCVQSQLRYAAEEFEQFSVNDDNASSVTFCLKELRALLSFVETFRVSVSVYFDEPGKPIIFALESDPNFTAELILASYIVQEDQSQSQQQLTANSTSTRNNNNNETQRSSVPSRNNSQRLLSTNNTNRTQQNGESYYARANAPTVLLAPKSSASKNLPSSMPANRPLRHSESEETMDEDVRDALPPSPPSKKPRSSYLFDGWSQRTMGSTTASQIVADDIVVLAPDSDLEDY